MSFVFSPNMTQIQEYIDANKYTQLIAYLKTCQLESLTNTTVISKLIARLDSQSNYLIIIYFLSFLADYPLQVFQNETKEALDMILNHSKGIEKALYDLLIQYINRKRLLDPEIITQALAKLFKKEKGVTKEESELYYNMTLEYIKNNKDLQHSFWEKVIQIFQLNNQFRCAMKLLLLYPLQYSLSESFWKKQVDLSKDFMLPLLFDIFNAKYHDRKANESIDSYMKIFNYFINTIGSKYSELGNEAAMKIFGSIIDNKIKIDEESLSLFIINYTKANVNTKVEISTALVKASTNMTSKIASDVINILFEKKEMESIVSILRLIKRREIIAESDLLTIPKETMDEIKQYSLSDNNASESLLFRSQLQIPEDNFGFLSIIG